MNKEEKIKQLKEQLAKYEEKLAYRMKTYRGVSHENALSELKHSEVMVLKAMVNDLKMEIYNLERDQTTGGENSKEKQTGKRL